MNCDFCGQPIEGERHPLRDGVRDITLCQFQWLTNRNDELESKLHDSQFAESGANELVAVLEAKLAAYKWTPEEMEECVNAANTAEEKSADLLERAVNAENRLGRLIGPNEIANAAEARKVGMKRVTMSVPVELIEEIGGVVERQEIFATEIDVTSTIQELIRKEKSAPIANDEKLGPICGNQVKSWFDKFVCVRPWGHEGPHGDGKIEWVNN
jgi:hypothetical protein